MSLSPRPFACIIVLAAAALASACSDAYVDGAIASPANATEKAESTTVARTAGLSSVTTRTATAAEIIEHNRRKALGNHHDHSVHTAESLTGKPPRLNEPGAPQYADHFDGPYRPIHQQQGRASLDNHVADFVGRKPSARAGACVLDFATPNLMAYMAGGHTYWADRTYIPWLRDCGGAALLDLRWSKYGHMHVGFEDTSIEFCATDPDATAAHIDINGNCTLVDLNAEPRSHVITHGWDEVLVLSAYYQNDYTRVPFDLKRIRIASSQGARVCYRKVDTPPSNGPWVAADGHGTGTHLPTAGGWACWNHLGPGHWDLSSWADDVIAVKITGSAMTPGTFAIDDIHVVVH